MKLVFKDIGFTEARSGLTTVCMWLVVTIVLLGVSVLPSKADCLSNIDMVAVATIAQNWLRGDCGAPNWCSGADSDLNQQVNLIDYSKQFGSAEPLVLVDQGICNVSIHNVSSGTPSKVETYAAQQLQAAFQTVTGVTPVINPASPAAIKIRLGLAGRFPVGVGNQAKQAYAVRRANDGTIELVGNSADAVLWAVDDFCERVLHVSWPVADDMAAVQGGALSTVLVGKLCEEFAPDFERRGWLIGDSTDGLFYNNKIVNWMSHNRQSIKGQGAVMLPTTYTSIRTHGLEPDTGTVHNFWWLVPRDTYFASHPEYFPLINGVRTAVSDNLIGPQLCVSNAGVFNIIVQQAVQSLYSYPDMRVFGIVPNDGTGGWCQCDNCKAWDGDQLGTGVYSNRLIHLCNSVADYLHGFYPNLKIGTLAYSEYVNPPTINVSDNVVVYYCTGGRNYMKKLTDASDGDNAEIMSRINGWLSKATNVALYEYYYFTGMSYCPMPYARTLCEEFPELKALGIKGVSAETTSDRWAGASPFPYVFARSTWDTSLSFESILYDYCQRRYGPAAADMQAYHALYESTIYSHVPVFKMFGPAAQLFPPAFSEATLNTLDGYLTSAAANAAASGSAYNVSSVASDRSMFNMFRSVKKDPATIVGIGPNLVLNPGAESGSSSWLTNIQSGNYAFSVSSDSPHSGNYSLKIECTGSTGRARWYQNNSPVIAGRKYAARFWIRASGGAHGEIWLYQSGGNLGQIAFQDSNNEWVQLVCPEVIAIDNNSIRIHLNSEGPGVVQIDDCFLAELPN